MGERERDKSEKKGDVRGWRRKGCGRGPSVACSKIVSRDAEEKYGETSFRKAFVRQTTGVVLPPRQLPGWRRERSPNLTTPLVLIQLRLMRLKPLIIQLNWLAALLKWFKVKEGDRKRMSRDEMSDVASVPQMEIELWREGSSNSKLLWSPHDPSSVEKSPPFDPKLTKFKSRLRLLDQRSTRLHWRYDPEDSHLSRVCVDFSFLMFVLHVHSIHFPVSLTGSEFYPSRHIILALFRTRRFVSVSADPRHWNLSRESRAQSKRFL